jgi:hypothetical protein
LQASSGSKRSKLELWEVYDVAQVGVGMYRTTATEDLSAKAELRERLLGREFFDVRTDGWLAQRVAAGSVPSCTGAGP